MRIENNIIFIEDPSELTVLKRRQLFTIKCVKCGCIKTRQFKPRELENYKTMKCSSCLRSEHISDTLSARSQEDWDKISKKREDFWLRTRGCRSNMQCPEIVQKVKDLWANKSPEEKERWRQQSIDFWENATEEEKSEYVLRNKESKLDKHGDENYNNAKQMSKTKKNWTPEQKQQMLDRLYSTNLDLYGDPYYNNSKQMSKTKKNWTPEQKQQMLDRLYSTNLDLYGDPYYNNSKQAKETTFLRYNTYSISYNYNYYGIRFDSAWELAVWIYCIDHNIPIIREPISFKYFGPNGVTDDHDYEVDFMINGKLVEVKGSQFLKPDGTMYCPYTKKKVNGRWIDMTPKEKEYMDDLFEAKHQCGLANGVEFWTKEDCKNYIEYCDINYPGWNKLFLANNPLNPSYWCITNNVGYYNPQYFAPYLINTMNNGKGVTPFDIQQSQKYAPITGKGLTPFDI